MRLVLRVASALALGTAFLVTYVPPAGAQNPDELTPQQSAARARELIQAAIQALGGKAYLGVRDISCAGRLAQFGTSGELDGYVKIFDYVLLPDKNRTEYSDKHNIIEVNNGSQAWTLDRGGVEESPPQVGQHYLEGLMKDIDHLFRFRLNEEGLILRYAGRDIVDLKPVDWIEVVDRDRRTMRIAFEKASHLPLRDVYLQRDPETRARIEEIEYFSNYHSIGGVQTPFQLERDRNGRKSYQVFWSDCRYNTSLEESFFTRQALEERWAHLSKGKKKK